MSDSLRIVTDESVARRILLAQSVETVDTQGTLISDVERDELDLRAIDEARAANAGRLDRLPEARHIQAALTTRAERVIDIVGAREPALAKLKDVPSWRGQLISGLPLVALVLGVVTDQVANPHRIDLLSPPLLALVLWNVAVYAFLLVRLVRPRRAASTAPGLRAAVAWLSQPHGRLLGLRASVRARFLSAWNAVAAPVTLQRAALILHLSAAAWAAGVALSLFVRGLVWQYRVGWEATFLTAEQLQSLLRLLFFPVSALTGLEPFTANEIVAMRFDATPDPMRAIEHGRHWVYLYASLLAIVVVVPRLALATWAALRMKLAARALVISLADPYFQQLIDRLVPARVVLSIVTHRTEDRLALDRMLEQHAEDGLMLATSSGDVLQAIDRLTLPSPATPAAERPLADRVRAWLGGGTLPGFEQPLPTTPDVLLHVIGRIADLNTAVPEQEGTTPVLLVVRAQTADDEELLVAQGLLRKKHHASIVDVLPFPSFGACWPLEPHLFDALAATMPATKAQGFERLAKEWTLRNRKRFHESMRILAGALAQAARATAEVGDAPVSLRTLLSKERRDARETAKSEAMAAVVARLKAIDADALLALLALHRLQAVEAEKVERAAQDLVVRVDTRAAVDAPQAGIAGAASGAAMGASVDLVTGGLTLGVAAMLGALVGGSAAFLSAAWNNRKSPSGGTTIQLSDEMLQALVEAALLRYLAVIHLGRERDGAGDGARPEWSSEVVASVEMQRARLAGIWKSIRTDDAVPDASAPLPTALAAIMVRVLRNLYPSARLLPE